MKQPIKIFFSDEFRINYLCIPKTGSSTIKAFYGMGDCWGDPEVWYPIEYPILVTIRDIYSRFLSSYDQLYKTAVFTGSVDEFIEKTANNPHWNPHVTPQSHYLSSVGEFDHVIWTKDIYKFIGKEIQENKSEEKRTLTEVQRIFVEDIYREDLKWLERYSIA